MVDKKLFDDVAKASIDDDERLVFQKENVSGANYIPWLNFKALLASLFLWLGDIPQTVAGVITFSKSPIVPDPTTDLQAVNLRTVNSKTTDPTNIDFVPQTQIQQPHKLGRIIYDSNENTWTLYNDIAGISLQLGEELRARLVNDTGFTLLDGRAVSITGAVGSSLQVELLDCSELDSSIRGFGLITIETDDGDPGYAVRYGLVRDIDTNAFEVGNIIYGDPDNAGDYTNVRPIAPNYPVRIGICLIKSATIGAIGVDTLAFNGNDTDVNIAGAINGIVTQTPNVDFVVSGGVIYADVTNQDEPTKNLPFLIDGMADKLNTTTGTGVGGAARVVVPPGTDYENMESSILYIYINSGVPTLAIATSEPAIAFAKIADFIASNATDTDNDGIFGYRRSNNAIDLKNGVNDGSIGIIEDLIHSIRDKLGSNWMLGQDATTTVNDTTIRIALSSGVGRQFRKASLPAFDGLLYRIYNDNTNTVSYEEVTNLTDIEETAAGVTLLANNSFYTIRIFYLLNSNGIGNRVIATRPLGKYSNLDEAIQDPLNYTVSMNDTSVEEIVFPLYDLVISRKGGAGATIVLGLIRDLRTKLAGGVGGGGASGGGGTDDKTRISAADTTNDYLNPKVNTTGGLKQSIINPGANEQLQIEIDRDTLKWLVISNASATAANIITVTDETEFDKANSGDAVRYVITGTNGGTYRGYIYAKSAWGGSSGTYTILGAEFASGELSALEYSNIPGIVERISISMPGYFIQTTFGEAIKGKLLTQIINRGSYYLAGGLGKVESLDTGTITLEARINLAVTGETDSDLIEISTSEFTINPHWDQESLIAGDVLELDFTAATGTPNHDATDLIYFDFIIIKG